MKLDRMVDQFALDVEAIIAGLAAALVHLEEWTGEYPGSASGAPPASASGFVADSDEDADGEAELSRFEVLAVSGDRALRLQSMLLGHLRHAALLARSTIAKADGVELPVQLTADCEDLAVLRWAVRRLRADPDLLSAGDVDKLSRSVMKVRGLVEMWQPPAARPPTGCRLHKAAGDHEPIDMHNYSAQSLCRRCGGFRREHGADPSPAILRAWSKKIKPTAGQIAEAKAAAKKKRKAQLRRRRRV